MFLYVLKQVTFYYLLYTSPELKLPKQDKQQLVRSLSDYKIWIYTTGADERGYTFRNGSSQTYYKYGVFLDYTCLVNRQIMEQNSNLYHLNASYHWLIWGPESLMEPVSNDLNLCIDTEFIWSYRDASTDLIMMYDIYKIDYSWSAILTSAGYWNNSEGLNYNITEYKYDIRNDLQGLPIDAGILLKGLSIEELKENFESPQNKEKYTLPTFSYSIYQILMKKFNFSVKLYPTSSYGYVTEDGRYEGLVKMMGERIVDVHITPLSMNRARLKYMDFIAPIWVFRTCAMFRHPSITAKADALIIPLEPELWQCCVVAWIILFLILRTVFYIVARVCDTEDHIVWSDALLMVLGSICNQGSVLDSKWVSWRITFISVLFFTYMTNVYYNASIVSSLLSDPKQSIRTIKDLINSRIKVGAEQADYNRYYFETNEDPEVKEFYNKKILESSKTDPTYYTHDFGTSKMLHEQFAYHVEAIHVYPIIRRTFPEQKKCSLTEVEIIPSEVTYLAVRWSLPYKEMFTYGMRKIAEHGLLDHQNKLWRAKKPECIFPGGDVGSVGIYSLVPAFGIMASGLALSIINLIIELLEFNRCESRKKSAVVAYV